MPYIKEDRRIELDMTIEGLVDELKSLDGGCTAGDLNYTICMLLIETLLKDINYNNINTVIGVLECAKLEIYRRISVPYEKGKCYVNGDVFPTVIKDDRSISCE